MMCNMMEVDLHTITTNQDPDDIKVDDATATCHTETYTILHMPADDKCI